MLARLYDHGRCNSRSGPYCDCDDVKIGSATGVGVTVEEAIDQVKEMVEGLGHEVPDLSYLEGKKSRGLFFHYVTLVWG